MSSEIVEQLIQTVEGLPEASASVAVKVSTDAAWDPVVPCG